jgi:nucleotide-binding universal stress UspA family protein
MVAGIHRVLIPVRGRQNIIESAHIIEQLATSQALSVTLFHVECDGEASDTEALMKEAESLFPSVELVTKVVSDPNAAEAILNEAQKHYDLLILGAPEVDHNTEGLFAPMVDYLVRLAPCPTMIVKGSPSDEHWPPRRILVPTNGSRASRNAAEVSFALAPDGQTSVTVLNVVVQRGQSQGHTLPDRLQERQIAVAHQVVEGLRELGEARGTRTDADVRVGERAVPIILDVADQRDMDLIVLGTDVRAGSNHLSLGPRVERIIEGAPCPVIVINAS